MAVVAGATLFAVSALAQEIPPPSPTPPIQDNSFLIEEAYNQPAGVVQHISTFSVDRGGDGWAYSFTQEWPLFSQRHQVSFTLPVQRQAAPLGTGIGDVALNYRYQLPVRRAEVLAIAPRLSVVLPTGDVDKGRGAGGAGLQANLPVSGMLSQSFVTHFNAGATYTPSAENAAGDRRPTTGFNAGQSLIWLARPALNLMLELAWNRNEDLLENGDRARSNGLLLAPGVRGALNFPSGLQIVPGIAVPIGIGPSKGERSVFFYVSFEHAFTKTVQ
ncbi:MAG: transporter [Gemmatimonadaceae bacterium]